MKLKPTKLAGIALAIVITCLMSGCQPERTSSPSLAATNEFQAALRAMSPSSTNEFQAEIDLEEAVGKMRWDYHRDQPPGKTPPEEIPARYWCNPIKALHPIKVYEDQGNVVVVQKIANGIEYGKYIGSVYSSHHPGPEFIRSRSDTNILTLRDYQKRVLPK